MVMLYESVFYWWNRLLRKGVCLEIEVYGEEENRKLFFFSKC